jgi:caffeoyl-CoA O-methyltransferase
MAFDIVSPEIEAYAAKQSTPLPALLVELMAETEQRFGERATMLSGELVGNLLQTLAAALSATRTLDIGCFTGFSAQMVAAALPDDGEVITLEFSPEHAALAREFFARSENGHKITLMEGPALDSIARLRGPFDLVFIDADKPNYINYYEAVLPLLADRGVIIADNVLWSGEVTHPRDDNGRAIAAFNDHVANDKRSVQVMLPVRDGLLLIRKT